MGVTLGRSYVERALLQVVNDALQPALSVERVRVDSLTRLSFFGLHGSDVAIQAAHVHLSPWVAWREGPLKGIHRIDVIEPRVAGDSRDLTSSKLSLYTVHRALQEFPQYMALLSEYLAAAPTHPGLSIRVVEAQLSAEEDAPTFDALINTRSEGNGYALSASMETRDRSVTAQLDGFASSGEMRLDRLELKWAQGTASIMGTAKGEVVRGRVHLRSMIGASAELARLQVDFSCQGVTRRCNGEFEAHEGRVAHHPFSRMTGEFTTDPGRWRLTELAAEGPGESGFAASGEITFTGERWAARSEVRGRHIPIVEALGWVSDQPDTFTDIEGELEGNVEVAGDERGLVVTAELRAPEMYLADALITDSNLYIQHEDGATRVRGTFPIGSGRIWVPEITMGTEGVAGEILVENVAAPDLARAARGVGVTTDLVHAVGGRISGSVRVQGESIDHLEAAVMVHADRLSYRSTQLAPLRIDGLWQADGGWRVDRLELMGIRGSAHGESVRNVTLDAEWEDVALSRLHRLVDWSAIQHVSGVTSGRLSAQVIDGNVTGEGSIQASLDTESSTLDVSGDVRMESPADVTFHGKAEAAEGIASFDGVWSPDPVKQRLEVRLSDFPGSALAEIARLPTVYGPLTGVVEAKTLGSGWDVTAAISSPELILGGYSLRSTNLSVDVSGPADPELQSVCVHCLYGESSLQASVVKADGRGGELGTLGFRVTFSGREAFLESMTLPFLGGSVTAAGRAALRAQDVWELDVQSTGRGLQFQDGGVALNVDYDIGLTGPLGAPTLSGRVQTSSGEIDLLGLAGGRLDGPGEGALARVTLDLEADIRNVYLVARSLVDAEVGGALEVKGSLSQPAVFGRVEARRGLFRYGPTRFDIDEATATFSGHLVPQLSVVGTGRVDGRSVEARVEGPADALELRLLVDGIEDSRGALGLLGPRWHENANETGWRELGAGLLGWLDDEVVSEAYWHLGRALERTFDLDRFRIEPDRQNGGMQLDMGKYLTPELYLSYRRSLSESGNDGVGLEYLLAPGVRLRTDWGDEERPDIGLELRLPF